jgi:hypothetical protein
MTKRFFWPTILGTLLLCGSVMASTVYVSQSGGSVSCGADGTQSTESIATFNGGSQIAGNTYKLCGNFTTAMTPSSSGTSGSPITVFFETGAEFTPGVCPSNGCIDIQNLAYVVVDGGTACGWVGLTEVSCNGKILPTASGTAYGNGGTQSITIEGTNCANCEIRNLELSTYVVAQGDTNPTADMWGIHQGGESTVGATFYVHNNIIHDTSSAIAFVPGSMGDSGFHYEHNYIYNINSGSDISNNGNGTVTQALVDNNYYGTTANWDEPGCSSHHNSLHSFAYSDERNGSQPYVITGLSESGTTVTGTLGGPAWTASHSYAAGAVITPTSNNANNNSYQVTSTGAGTSGSTQPNWASSACCTGNQLTDGGVTWQNIGSQDTTRMTNGGYIIVVYAPTGYNTPLGSVTTAITAIPSSTTFQYTAATSGLAPSSTTTGNVLTHWNANVQFYNNFVSGNWGGCPTSELFYEGSGSFNVNAAVYGNVFNGTYTQENNGVFSVAALGNVLIANNTIIGDFQSGDKCFGYGSLSNSSWTIYNNIISSCYQPFATNDTVATLNTNVPTMDYETWGGTSGSPWGTNTDGPGPGVYFTSLTGAAPNGWTAVTGYDAHSNWYNSNTYVKVNSNGTLQSGSPAIAVGKNLTSPYCGTYSALCTDMAGNTRQTGSTPWDDGALNYASGSLTYVGGATPVGSSTTVTSASVTYTPTPGNEIVLFLGTNGSVTSLSCHDSESNSLTAGPTTNSNLSYVYEFYYSVPATAPTSFTCSWATRQHSDITVVEYSGVLSVNGSPTGDTAAGDNTNPSISPTSTVANDFMVAGFYSANNVSWAAQTGHLRVSNSAAAANGGSIVVVDNFSSTSGSSVTESVTFGSPSEHWAGVVIELIP